MFTPSVMLQLKSGSPPALSSFRRIESLSSGAKVLALAEPARWLGGRVPVRRRSEAAAETAYCAGVLATTYGEMGLLPGQVRPNAYDPGSFWSGDRLKLKRGFRLGSEITIEMPPAGA